MHRSFVALAAASLLTLLAACAGAPAHVEPIEALLAPGRFSPPAEPVSTAHVLEASEAMRQYLRVDMGAALRRDGPQRGLVEALQRRTGLRLEYDAVSTKTAAEAFDTRSGNCLSLVLMTASLARELDLTVHHQRAWLDQTWSRSGNPTRDQHARYAAKLAGLQSHSTP